MLNNFFGLLKIIGIVGNFRNCGIISKLLICEFSRIFGIFSIILLWKSIYFRILEIIRIVEKFRNCGIISRLLICELLKICWDIFRNFNVKILFYWIIGNVGIVEIVGIFWEILGFVA